MYSSIFSSTALRSASISATWPPTMPLTVPAAPATSVRMAARRSAGTGVAPMVSNASVKSPSPARIARASPNFLRRGKPTCHKKFGEALAILAGDGLLTLAFETIGATPVPAERRAAILTEVAGAAGTVNGMVGGQVADIEAERKAVDEKMLEY